MEETQQSRSRFPREAFLVAGILALWVPLIIVLIPTWQRGQYYSYGWLVVPAALFFAWERARDLRPLRPLPGRLNLKWWILFCVLLAALLWGVRIFETIDVTWRRVFVFHSLVVAASTWTILTLAYGKRVGNYFLPVIIFALTAVPLLVSIESGLIRFFTQGVVNVSAEVLRLVGHPITVKGDMLVSVSGTVEITEGCSGLRSFQSLFMASIFLGELCRLRLGARVLLVVAGSLVGFLTNVMRSVVLSLISLSMGEAAFDRWHDTVGFAAFGVAILVLYLVARWWDGRTSSASPGFSANAEPAGLESAFRTNALVGGVAAVMLATEGLVALWFTNRSIAAPSPRPVYRLGDMEADPLDLSESPASSLLNYDSAEWLLLSEEGRRHAIELFWFNYDRENRLFVMDVLNHSPEICMRTRGLRTEKEFAPRSVEVEGATLFFQPFMAATDSARFPIYVFKAHWIDGVRFSGGDSSLKWRINFVRAGLKRPPGAAVIILGGVSGFETEGEAWDFFVKNVFANSRPVDVSENRFSKREPGAAGEIPAPPRSRAGFRTGQIPR